MALKTVSICDYPGCGNLGMPCAICTHDYCATHMHYMLAVRCMWEGSAAENLGYASLKICDGCHTVLLGRNHKAVTEGMQTVAREALQAALVNLKALWAAEALHKSGSQDGD